jgi:hypothetical protein
MAERGRRPVETRDVDPRALMAFAAALAGSLALILVGLRLAFGPFPSPLPFTAATGLSRRAEPVLQPAPRSDRARYEAEKAKALRSAGWIDRGAGIAHIPIEDAMKIVAEHGIPDWGQHAPPATGECARLAANVPRAPQAADCLGREAPR